jgi:hypothetical protein
MSKSFVMAAVAASTVLTSAASASILVYTDQLLWNLQTASLNHSTENFSSYSGAYASPMSGSTGAVNWTATATGGLLVNGGALTTSNSTPMTLSFSGAAVQGIAGNIYGTDVNTVAVPSLVLVTLNDGTSYLNLIDTATAFVGFYSTGAAITSVQVSAQPLPGGTTTVFATVDNLNFATVPAPGAVALLGLAGLAGSRRRR